ncbi:polysaccharide lyase family 4 protein [Cucurbitaria berberidis CBS 394.84]|uniref:Rhamnogalacturonate lyase n=1 Tax=Cucurbitaria berberidis CBS 394.84 TaxID=1168544 RepID=A0A9P4GSC2_9PLEO|nr:polysaccharide lyase family 4 protein [Cucurbitaria berberidis CBS 394.84]KAF1850576.1 polysaccharide lyase family 4 protein [Cucurbitaria berberidis CBS 394.84]
MRSIANTAVALALGQVANAAFGFTTTSTGFSVDTDGGLVFQINKANGDLTSLKYNGVEYQGTGKASSINSGLGASTVTAENIDGHVKITVKSNGLPVTHYYVAKKGDATVYLATKNQGSVDPGELRFLARLKTSELPTGVHGDVGDNRGCTAFEGKDTFKCANGHTSCKMYTSDRFIEDKVHCVSGSKAQVCMVMPGVAYETSAGGPFMRDINSQTTSGDQELYWYMNSGHVRTEDWRSGLNGPYAMTFTAAGTKPSENLDTSFFGSLKIDGYVGESGRGSVTGKATGVPSTFEAVVHWSNKDAQYWTKAQGGNYKSPLMKPGSYTVKLYKGEFLVSTDTVTVTAGQTTTKDIASKESAPAVVWRIGEFDGQPFELKNGDKITRMHPSDSRMSSWSGGFTVGTSKASDFPMALWSKQGSPATVTFSLTSAQVKSHVLRIGTTLSFKTGRPSVKIGSWTGTDPGAPKLIDSRGVTRGAYRGYGEVYTWDVPASAFREGSNTLTVGVIGSGSDTWLSANYIVDALELQV